MTALGRPSGPVRPHGRRLRGQRGFTLLEMAIVIAIIGTLIAILAPIGGRILESTQRSGTEDKLALIESALVAYLRDFGRLPCPAAPNGSPFGVEQAACTTGSTMDGIVPFATLGISEVDAKDAYGGFITYHVAVDYADPSVSSDLVNFCLVEKPASGQTDDQSLSIEDADGDEITDEEVAYILVSHGANGLGRYLPPNTGKVDGTSGGGVSDGGFENENADSDEVFVDTLLIEEDAADGPFDDQVAWRSRDELAAEVRDNGCNLGDVDATTETHLDRVEAAIVAFLRRNGRIPCPAQPEDDDPLGVEETPNCDGSDEKGIVPFRTLGLTESFAQDGYGRLLTYHVTHEYTETGDLASFCAETEWQAIAVEDENGDDVVDDYQETPLVYVLVSHGANGFGAFEAGSANPVDANGGVSAEDENADSDGDFNDAPPITSGQNAGYDDVTRWITRDLLAEEAGGCP